MMAPTQTCWRSPNANITRNYDQLMLLAAPKSLLTSVTTLSIHIRASLLGVKALLTHVQAASVQRLGPVRRGFGQVINGRNGTIIKQAKHDEQTTAAQATIIL